MGGGVYADGARVCARSTGRGRGDITVSTGSRVSKTFPLRRPCLPPQRLKVTTLASTATGARFPSPCALTRAAAAVAMATAQSLNVYVDPILCKQTLLLLFVMDASARWWDASMLSSARELRFDAAEAVYNPGDSFLRRGALFLTRRRLVFFVFNKLAVSADIATCWPNTCSVSDS